MKAIRITQYGDNNELKIQDVTKPEPKAGEALVKLKAAGLNFIDIYMREGVPRVARDLPFTPGLEGAGIVEAVGEGVHEVKPGDRVAYTGQLGSYAEYNVVKASQLIPLPDEISFEQGAAFPLQGMTAHYLLHEYYPIQPGTNVLVHAAAGGMGLLLVQWLKHLGARVIGTVSTEEKARAAQEAGADDIIMYTQQDFVTETKLLTNGVGADYIIDGVGKTTFTKNLSAIRTRGWICIFGMASGPADPVSPNMLQPQSITVVGGNLSNYLNSREELLRRSGDVMRGILDEWLKLNIDSVWSLDKAKEAQAALESRQTSGKVILTME